MIPILYPDTLTREDGAELKCRFYPGIRSRGITKVKDGAIVDAQFTIALPKDAPQLLVGEVITGYDVGGEVIVWRSDVVLFHRGQLHCVAYV